MRREALKYLYDIKVAVEKILRFTQGKGESDYLSGELLQSGTERQFEIIGEAIGQLYNLDASAAERIPDFRKMISFRNILIHGYASVDPVIVWGVVEENLSDLQVCVESMLEQDD
jgi:uncharacterized protein with HEPN domain